MANLRAVTVLTAVCLLQFINASKLCLAGDFDQQFSYIIENEVLTDDDIREASSVFQKLEDLLQDRWPGTTVTPFGSLVTGLALKASDADCLARVPGYNETLDRHLVIESTKLLMQDPAAYLELDPKLSNTVPIITFYYAPTQRYCDLSFRGPSGVENSKLMKYFMFLDRRVRAVTAFLKFWSKIHKITATGMLPSYALGLLVTFFFQQKGILPAVVVLQNNSVPRYVNDWDTGFNMIPFQSSNNESVYHLVAGFFKYYSEFDFDHYVVSTFLGRPVLKSDLTDMNAVPDEYVIYKRHMKERGYLFNFRSNMSIQDPFEHNRNVVNKRDAAIARLLYYLKLGARMFEKFPKDKVLLAILSEKNYRRVEKLKKRLVIDEIAWNDCK